MGRRKEKTAQTPASPRLQLKVIVGEDAIGPGKIELLRLVEVHGGISAAARAMDLGYRRAWDLLHTLGQAIGSPVITTATGGAHGGGARLTETGQELLRRYAELEAAMAKPSQSMLTWIEEQRTLAATAQG